MSFSAGLKKFGRTMEKDAIKAISNVAEEAIDGVVKRTPKDSGTAAANWNMDSVVETDYDESRTSYQSNLDSQKSMSMPLATDAVKTGKDIVVSNPAPYAVMLERGHSNKAPLGMVALTVIEIKSKRTL